MLSERFYERRAARRYCHMMPGRSCNQMLRGLCLRCLWRDVTGKNRRDKAAYIARIREHEVFAAPTSFRPLQERRAPRPADRDERP